MKAFLSSLDRPNEIKHKTLLVNRVHSFEGKLIVDVVRHIDALFKHWHRRNLLCNHPASFRLGVDPTDRRPLWRVFVVRNSHADEGLV